MDDGLNVKGKCKLIDKKDVEDKLEKKSTSCEETSAEHSAPRAESSTSSSDSKQIPQAKPAGIQGSIYMQMYLDSVNETSTTHEIFQQAAIFAWRESDEMSQEELQAIYHWMSKCICLCCLLHNGQSLANFDALKRHPQKVSTARWR